MCLATSDLGEGVTPDVVGCVDTAADATDATVTVTYRFTFITPVGIPFPDDHVDLVSKGVMPCLS